MSRVLSTKVDPPSDKSEADAHWHILLSHILFLKNEEKFYLKRGKLKKMSLALTRFR